MADIKQPRLNQYAKLIEDGRWQESINQMAENGHTSEEIDRFCDAINFYPSEEFWKYKQRRIAEVTAMRQLNRIFNNIVNS